MLLSNVLELRPSGLYSLEGGFYIDPILPVENAVITHGHGDHARAGHTNVLATQETIRIMQARYGGDCAKHFQTAHLSMPLKTGKVSLTFLPAGHILGSAQLLLVHQNQRILISGDYKRQSDPTCLAYAPSHCDIFITESTFGLPIFKHPAIEVEIDKLLLSLQLFPNKTHLIGAYALGKCQRMIKALRAAKYDAPIFIHGAMQTMCNLYEEFGIKLGTIYEATTVSPQKLKGQIVFCPPAALHDRWSRRMPEVIKCYASGWMQTRARAKQKGVSLPLVISDHADWNALHHTINETNAEEIYVTHGQPDALLHSLRTQGRHAYSLPEINIIEKI